MKITVERLESLDDYQRRALVPMLNLIFGYVGTNKWSGDWTPDDPPFRASLDYFRQAFYGDDPEQIRRFYHDATNPGPDMYKRFIAGADMIVDRYMRSDLGWEKMTIDGNDLQAVARYCNPNWTEGCPWDPDWSISDMRLLPLGASVTRAFNFAYMSCREHDEKERKGDNA